MDIAFLRAIRVPGLFHVIQQTLAQGRNLLSGMGTFVVGVDLSDVAFDLRRACGNVQTCGTYEP